MSSDGPAHDLVDPDERPFLEAIVANPDDDELRLVYADWLEERGDERVAWLRKEVELRQADEPRTETRLRNELAVLAQSVDWSWRLAISRVHVVNCERGSGSTRSCGRRWLELDDTKMTTPSDRFCDECEQVVRFVRSVGSQHPPDRPFCLDELVQGRVTMLETLFRYRYR